MYLSLNFIRLFKLTGVAIFLVTVLGNNSLTAQDFHYSQFYNQPLAFNPAMTGIFNGDERISGSIRDQWRSVPVPWFNFSVGYDRKFYPKKSNKGFFGGGIYFNYDTQGDANVRLTNINLSGSYTRVLNPNNLITIGAAVGFSSRGFNPANLTWDQFWDPDLFAIDPSRGSGENITLETFNFIETSLGFNYRWQKSARTKLDIGVSGFHLTTPSAKFLTSTVTQSLPVRLSFTGVYSRRLTDKMDLQLDALYQIQDAYNELLFGGYLNFYLNQQRGKEFQFRVGVGYRTRQAIYPKIGIEFNNLFISGSYDIYIDDFTRQHGGGGPELHIRYIIKHVKPLGKFKACPIF